jgi:malonyl-CoA O-methyltransferase
MSAPAPGADIDRCFTAAARRYDREARLQQAVAWRLARLCRSLPLPQGPRLDLGSGTGRLARALETQLPDRPLLRVDRNVALMAEGHRLVGGAWRRCDLDDGLPADLHGAGLIASSFALHWLEQPDRQLRHWITWLRPGGWLALAVPVAGSLDQWHRAAAAAGCPCTARPLPERARLLAACTPLELQRVETRRFSQRADRPADLLRQFRRQGTQASPAGSLPPGAWRRLWRAWPRQGPPPDSVALTWAVLLLIGQRR